MADTTTSSEAGKRLRKRQKKLARQEKSSSGAVQQESAPQPAKQSESVMEFLGSIAAVFVIGLFIITFIVQAFEIPSGSMISTLLIGDHVFVDRERFAPPTSWMHWALPYRQIKRGDIIVFLSVTQPGMYIVKRIRGVPGDRIHLHEGQLYVNGQLQNEPFVHHEGGPFVPYRDNFPDVPPTDYDQVTPEWRLTLGAHLNANGDLVVPPDSYFAMGDNREISLDSRYWGFVPQQNVIGRPLFIYWSFVSTEDEYQQKSWSERAGNIVHVIIHFFDQTRWRRTLKMVR